MQISQKKSKDAELTLDVYATLEKIAITGWIDEDGDQVYSAVLSPTDAPVAIKKDSKLDSHRKLFEKVWFATGTEVREEMPYISRSAFMAKLDADGWAKRTAENALKPSTTNGFVNLMEGGDVIKSFEHGWIMIDQVNASALIMMKNEK